jgi:hypothetical protein
MASIFFIQTPPLRTLRVSPICMHGLCQLSLEHQLPKQTGRLATAAHLSNEALSSLIAQTMCTLPEARSNERT